MNTFDSSITTISLALEAHSHAKRFRQHHREPAKAKAVYLNTLAVCAVETYLKRSGFDPDVAQGASWQPTQQMLMDSADLWVPGYGRVECRPVLPEQTEMLVPPEVWDGRLCFVAVQLDATLRTATLLGFINKVDTQDISLAALQPLDELMDYLLQHAETSVEAPSEPPLDVLPDVVSHRDGTTMAQPESTPAKTQLGRWLQNALDSGWQTIDQLVNMARDSKPTQLAWGFREADTAAMTEPSSDQPSVVRGKQLTLAVDDGDVQVGLMVGLPKTIQPDMNIRVQVSPIQPSGRLPANLMLMVLDATGASVMQAQARSTEAMELSFGVDPGEAFSLKLELDGVSVTESFIV